MFDFHKNHQSSMFDYKNKLETIKTSGFRFEVHLTEHCNLNCKGCSHFSPLANEEFLRIESFEKDMERMAELFSKDSIQMITLLGGEPLLHPQVNDFMRIVVKNFPNMPLQLVTNGLLLHNKSKSFWETCRATGTFIRVSHYPISLDFLALKEKAMTEGVELFVEPEEAPKNFHKDIYDLSGSLNEHLSHSACEIFGSCCQLNSGKFFPCNNAANFHHLNIFFNLGISESADNYIDIYKAQSKDEFIKLITSPIPYCKYCNMNAQELEVKWDHSKRSLNEWI